MTESNRIEYKRELTDSLEKEVTGKQTTGKTAGKSSPKTTEKILEAMIKNPTISATELAKHLRISYHTIDWNLRKLRKEHSIRRIGPAGGGHWGIIKGDSR